MIIILDVQYLCDAIGRIATKTETIGGVLTVYEYGYDVAGRLVSVKENGVTVSTYDYDANGNRVTAVTKSGTYQGFYDLQDRMTKYGNADYTYTANGELKTKTDSTGAMTYNYDVYGNLRGVTMPDGTVIDYVIDASNRRIGKKVNGALVQGFIYKDQLEPIAELDGAGNIVARYVYASKGHVPDYMVKGGVTYRIISDHLGSVRMVVNAADNSITQRIDYDEFGNIVNDTNPGFQHFAFAGGLYDQHTKLTRFGARDYDPHTGRWTSKDPILFDGNYSNLFGYCFNDSITYYDVSGLRGFGKRLPGGRKPNNNPQKGNPLPGDKGPSKPKGKANNGNSGNESGEPTVGPTVPDTTPTLGPPEKLDPNPPPQDSGTVCLLMCARLKNPAAFAICWAACICILPFFGP